jgi:uncharacterized protein
MAELNDKLPLDDSSDISSNFNGGFSDPEKPQKGDISPFVVLMICISMFIAGNIVGSGLMLGLAYLNGLDFQVVLKNLSADTPVGTRNFMRAIMLINHFFSFILPSLITGWIVYKTQILKGFRLTKVPLLPIVGLGIVWLLVSMPLVQYAYQVNKMIPLPDWMMDMENSTGNILEAIISKESFYEVIINVLLIAVIPAIGEELMFRGIIQQQIGRILSNEHLTVWISAAFFSAIHMQFQGFFARMILGALLGYLLIWSRTLWVPMIIHFLNNGMQVVALYVMDIKPNEMEKIAESDKLHWTMGMASLMLAIMVGKYIREKYYLPEENLPRDNFN